MVRIKECTIIYLKTLYQNLSIGSRKSTDVSIKIPGLQYAVAAIIASGYSFPICSFHSTFVTLVLQILNNSRDINITPSLYITKY